MPHIGKPDYRFHPCEYAGYLPADEQVSEAYTKLTCLWTGNGFVMPTRKPVAPDLGSMMHRLPPTDDRADLRSATPRGFARAVFGMHNWMVNPLFQGRPLPEDLENEQDEGAAA